MGGNMSNQQKELLNICVWCAILLFAIRCIISWQNLISNATLYELFGYASEAISISVLFTCLYEKVLWRINPFEKTPKLSNHYTGILKSNYDNLERSASLIVKQTLLSVHVTLITGESKSKSFMASIDDVLGETQLTYCYINTPKAEYRHRSEIHYGTAILSVVDTKTLEGQYYTDRSTKGDMLFNADK